MNALPVDRVARDEVGDGQPVVLVHGLAEDRRSWSPQLSGPHALHGARVVAVDLRGHGETPVGDGDGTLAQLGDDLAAVLRDLGEPAVVVGFSLGGTVVLDTARRYPDLVDEAVVIATSSVVGRNARAFFLQRMELATTGDRTAFAAALREDTAGQLHVADRLDEVVARRIAAVGDGAGYVNAARAMVGIADRPLTPDLAEVSQPVTVVGAEHDRFCPRRAAELLVAALSDARYVEVSGAGHLVNVERPDAVSAAIQQTIDRKVRT